MFLSKNLNNNSKNQSTMIKKTIEDYLRIIYNLMERKKEDKIRPIDISKEMNITKATVSKMLKKLKDEKYITIKPYSYIKLTSKGIREAKIIKYKYDIIVRFLKYLGYKNKKDIEKEAHNLEHSFSKKTLTKIDKIINKHSIISK